MKRSTFYIILLVVVTIALTAIFLTVDDATAEHTPPSDLLARVDTQWSQSWPYYAVVLVPNSSFLKEPVFDQKTLVDTFTAYDSYRQHRDKGYSAEDAFAKFSATPAMPIRDKFRIETPDEDFTSWVDFSSASVGYRFIAYISCWNALQLTHEDPNFAWQSYDLSEDYTWYAHWQATTHSEFQSWETGLEAMLFCMRDLVPLLSADNLRSMRETLALPADFSQRVAALNEYEYADFTEPTKAAPRYGFGYLPNLTLNTYSKYLDDIEAAAARKDWNAINTIHNKFINRAQGKNLRNWKGWKAIAQEGPTNTSSFYENAGYLTQQRAEILTAIDQRFAELGASNTDATAQP